jgi:hypothetical protein
MDGRTYRATGATRHSLLSNVPRIKARLSLRKRSTAWRAGRPVFWNGSAVRVIPIDPHRTLGVE